MSFSRPLAALAAFGLVLALAGPAAASPETLKRSVTNLTMAPLDLVSAPVAAVWTIRRNLADVDDSRNVRLFYPAPGFVWVTMNHAGASVLRGVAGALEFLPGLGLVFFETDMSPLFPPAVDNEALVNYETPLLNVKFGLDYITTPF